MVPVFWWSVGQTQVSKDVFFCRSLQQTTRCEFLSSLAYYRHRQGSLYRHRAHYADARLTIQTQSSLYRHRAHLYKHRALYTDTRLTMQTQGSLYRHRTFCTDTGPSMQTQGSLIQKYVGSPASPRCASSRVRTDSCPAQWPTVAWTCAGLGLLVGCFQL